VTTEFLRTGAEAALDPYAGTAFRARFRTRLLLRRALAAVRSPAVAEIALAALCLPPFRGAAERVFFGRGSFPDTGRPHSAGAGVDRGVERLATDAAMERG
jgi:hypothetical protein